TAKLTWTGPTSATRAAVSAVAGAAATVTNHPHSRAGTLRPASPARIAVPSTVANATKVISLTATLPASPAPVESRPRAATTATPPRGAGLGYSAATSAATRPIASVVSWTPGQRRPYAAATTGTASAVGTSAGAHGQPSRPIARTASAAATS